MIKCSPACSPCCDFCIWALHEELEDDNGEKWKGEPAYCELHDDFNVSASGACWDFHCFRATPKEHVYVAAPPEETDDIVPDESTRKYREGYGRALRRKNDWKKANRKRRICQKIYGWEYYTVPHRYSKNKIHCSCAMCSAKTRKKRHYGGGPKDTWSIRDQRRIDSMKEDGRDDFD